MAAVQLLRGLLQPLFLCFCSCFRGSHRVCMCVWVGVGVCVCVCVCVCQATGDCTTVPMDGSRNSTLGIEIVRPLSLTGEEAIVSSQSVLGFRDCLVLLQNCHSFIKKKEIVRLGTCPRCRAVQDSEDPQALVKARGVVAHDDDDGDTDL